MPLWSALEPLYQSATNYSEGRRPELVREIADAMASAPGGQVIDWSADWDHNRSVVTVIGTAEAIRTGALAAARVAVARIDLRTHSGIHPRTGAVDVLPITPLRNVERADAVALAHAIGSDLAAALELPIYFYEWAAASGRASALPDLRRGGFESFASSPLTADRTPDRGPCSAHATAGIAIVGARGPLVAYNVNLETPDLRVAQEIARRVRRERSFLAELDGVRALGLYLASRGHAQVSMNVTHPDRTPLPAVFRFIEREALSLGTHIAESEIIGAIPEAALGGEPPESILWRRYDRAQVLESWLPPA